MTDKTYPRILVCGGRDFADQRDLNQTLNWYKGRGLSVLIEGGARGADRLAQDWAKANGITVETYPADWDKHGKQAGYIRNRQMLDEGKPDLVIAFPGGRGTKMMVTIAKNANVEVHDYR